MSAMDQPRRRTRIADLPRRSRVNFLRALGLARSRRSTLAPVGLVFLPAAMIALVAAGLALLWLDAAAAETHWPQWLLATARALTDIGLSGWYLVPAAIVLIILNLTDWDALARRPLLQLHQWACVAVFVLASVGLSGILINIIKYAVGRARPYVGEGHLHFDPFPGSAAFASFPSGHSTTLGAVTAILTLFFPRLRFVLVPVGLALAATRIVVRAHFPSDVIVGFAIGFGFTIAVALFFARIRCLFRQGPRGYPELRRLAPFYRPR